MDRYTVAETVGLYEKNYKSLLTIFPRLREIEGTSTLVSGPLSMHLNVIEQCPYSSVIELSQDMARESKWLRCACIRLRVYHDAQVAEVISYQNHHGFKSKYDYPNEKMFYSREKRMLNLFLDEWLETFLSCMEDADIVSVSLSPR